MTLIQRSDNSLKLFKMTVQAITALGCVSEDTLVVLTNRVSFLQKLVDQFDLKGNASELKILYANHKTAHKILCDINQKVHKGDLVKYGYDF